MTTYENPCFASRTIFCISLYWKLTAIKNKAVFTQQIDSLYFPSATNKSEIFSFYRSALYNLICSQHSHNGCENIMYLKRKEKKEKKKQGKNVHSNVAPCQEDTGSGKHFDSEMLTW